MLDKVLTNLFRNTYFTLATNNIIWTLKRVDTINERFYQDSPLRYETYECFLISFEKKRTGQCGKSRRDFHSNTKYFK